jgi:hypothetical protein
VFAERKKPRSCEDVFGERKKHSGPENITYLYPREVMSSMAIGVHPRLIVG